MESRYSPAQLAARAAALPVITYPDLPVSAHRDEIAEAIQHHQVTVVAGETGSGKTTQIPKICLQLGRGIAGMIGHTQPRRIAARSVAERIAFEVGQTIGREPGQVIGYQVRFTDEVGPTTLVKLMTDGILLNEIQVDPDLTRYDTIIVDEAHERSLNIDFILGYLARLLPRRPDLKLIITSATIDSQRFADHFSAATGSDVPVIEVSGRTYPVEIRYRDDAGDEDLDVLLTDAVDELLREPDGDILVFLPGERDIREAQQTLSEHMGNRRIDIVPLFARLSAAEQQRIFHPGPTRRIILATNIAETSLTVPGIRYVIDPGLARISRFSNKTKVQRLPIERVSQASANQRSGRAGRVAPGIAIRLYSEEDFLGRAEYTEPEILRTSLASVILQMKALTLGEVAEFPFIDAPSRQAIRDGVQLLVELGALTDEGDLTGIGRKLSRLPIDPRLGRMLLAAEKEGCASEVLVIVAALSIQDVRERPLDNQAAADTAHARFNNPDSDFLTYLNLWRYLTVQSRDMSHSAFRRLCRSEFLHYLRFREWRDVVTQLRQMCKQIGISVQPVGIPDCHDIRAYPDTASAIVDFGTGVRSVDFDQVHRSLLVGLLSNIGNWDELRSNYQGARGARFTIWPGSGLSGRKSDWVMAAELVETSRLFARTVARIKVEWIESAGGHLVNRSYAEPYWSRGKGAAMIKERVLLYGMTLAADRSILLGQLGDMRLGNQGTRRTSVAAPGTIAAIAQGLLAEGSGGRWASQLLSEDESLLTARELAWEMFIRHALVEGKWRADYLPFVRHNRSLVKRAEEMAARLRDPSLAASQEEREEFFRSRIPPFITSAKSFEAWWKKQPDKKILEYSWTDVFHENPDMDEADFPTTWEQGNLSLKVSYPAGEPVTVRVPLSLLPQIRDYGFDWQVPGLLNELCTATIRALPKPIRRQLAPAPEVGSQIADYLRSSDSSWVPEEEPEEDAPTSLAASLERLAQWGQKTGRVSGSSTPPTSSSAGNLRDSKERSRKKPALVPEKKERSFAEAFAAAVTQLRGVEVSAQHVEQAPIPENLRIRFQVVDPSGKVVGQGPSLSLLQRQLSKQTDSAVSSAVKHAVKTAVAQETSQQWEKKNITDFPPQIPQSVESATNTGMSVRAYPALVDQGDQVDLLLKSNADQAQADHLRGVARLLLRRLRLSPARITTRWTGKEALMLAASPYPTTEDLVEDAQWAAALALARPVRTAQDFDNLVAEARDNFEEQVYQNLRHCIRALEAGVSVPRLLYPGFLSRTPAMWLPHVPRYLKAAESPRANDPKRVAIVQEVEDSLEHVRRTAEGRPYSLKVADRLQRLQWLIEELRVSLFAEHLGTSEKVSRERLLRYIDGVFRDLD
ncbi:ATP-dependent RNA helicase HrpA [Actinomycetaceae bacterium WB03_NA08]|uniref:ATP-dependent RNA helicase HrpA n=1 Tax=Scrofimicrobium canadense TaxID=2652290 RepID=A0A6N7W4U2_9ACTO|nr:ATP-dependent RNA helicase HrpA [Scrofimicrobium canadense]MSS84431.1 ATP-dependent RNA helicase HrpA [Scrofimicrobium canadense]